MKQPELKRGIKVLGITFLVYAILVAGHEGEFWPFSIYPMFSQAGNPWTRAMLLDVSALPEEQIWETQRLANLAAPPVPVGSLGVDQIDYSNFLSKTKNWTASRRNALRIMLGPEKILDRRWMAVRVSGRLTGDNSVVVSVQPYLLVTADSVYMNPYLNPSDYFAED